MYIFAKLNKKKLLEIESVYLWHMFMINKAFYLDI